MIHIQQVKKRKSIVAMAILIALFFVGCDKKGDSKDHLKKGLEYIEKGEYDKAKLELKTSSQAGKDNADTYYALALLDEKNRQYRAMRENLQKAIELAPENTEARLKLAKVQLLFNEPDAAIEQAEFILQGSKDNADALAIKASALHRKKKPEEAASVIETILKTNPNHADALSLKAMMFAEKEDYGQALALMDTAIKADPKNISLHVFKIQLDSKRKNVDAVIADYKLLISTFPENEDYKVTLAKVYLQAGKSKEAEDLIRGLITAEPNNVKVKQILLDFLSVTAKEKVTEQFRQFTEQHNDQARILLSLSKWMISRGSFDEAKKPLNRVIELEDDSNVGLSAKTLLAKMAFDKKDFDGAEKLVAEILDDNSNYNDAKILQARLLLVKEKYDEAIELLNKVLYSQPNSEEALLLLAQSYLVKNNPMQAEKHFTSVLNVNPGNVIALNQVYEKALKTGNAKYAKEILEKAISINASNLSLLEKLAKLNIADSDWDAAKATIQKINMVPDPLAVDLATFLQGQGFQGQGDCNKAVEMYKSLLTKLPENSGALAGMARCHESLNKRSEMISFLTESLAKNPRNLSAGILLGDLYVLNKEYDKGSTLLKNLIREYPDNPQLYSALASIYFAKKDGKAAIAVYQNGLVRMPGDIKLTLSLASLYELEKDYETVIKLYEALLEKNPQLDVATNNLATVLIDHYASEDALNKAVQLTAKFKDSDQPYFQDTYAWTLIKQGRIDEGLKLLDKIVIKSPDVAIFRYHLGVANFKNENFAAASAELKQALELAQNEDNALDKKAVESLLESAIAKIRGH